METQYKSFGISKKEGFLKEIEYSISKAFEDESVRKALRNSEWLDKASIELQRKLGEESLLVAKVLAENPRFL